MKLHGLGIDTLQVSSILESRIRGVQEEAGLAETGRVLSVGYAMVMLHVRQGRRH